MSDNNAQVHAVSGSGASLEVVRRDSYMAGRWAGYGYLAAIEIIGGRFTGRIENTRTQRVVWKTNKIHMGGPTERRAWDSLRNWAASRGLTC